MRRRITLRRVLLYIHILMVVAILVVRQNTLQYSVAFDPAKLTWRAEIGDGELVVWRFPGPMTRSLIPGFHTHDFPFQMRWVGFGFIRHPRFGLTVNEAGLGARCIIISLWLLLAIAALPIPFLFWPRIHRAFRSSWATANRPRWLRFAALVVLGMLVAGIISDWVYDGAQLLFGWHEPVGDLRRSIGLSETGALLVLAGLCLALCCLILALAWRYSGLRLVPRPPEKPLCIACGYDLTGNTSGICSECGCVIKSRVIDTGALVTIKYRESLEQTTRA